jgi:hypothetical protein
LGKLRNVIEHPKDDNLPNEDLIQKIKDGWKAELDKYETLPISA